MRIPHFVLGLLGAFTMLIGNVQADARDPKGVHVGILMFDGVQIIDFAAPYEVFGQARFRISTVSADGEAVTTSMGLKVLPDMAFADAADFDVVLVPGGEVERVAQDKEVQTWLRARSKEADSVLSVCTGAHILAATGLLENLSATTFHRAFDELAKISPSTKVVRDLRWVDSGKIITSAGLSSGIDAALHVVDRLLGTDRARTVAMHMEYDWHPEQGFVRGLMADRHMPKPSIQWPGDSRFERMAAYGDRAEWFERYRIHGKAAPTEYLKLIKAAYARLPNWTMKQADAQQLVLHGQPGDGVEANLRIDVSPAADDGGFDLTTLLQVKR